MFKLSKHKSILSLFILLSFSAFLFVSCGSDDEGEETACANVGNLEGQLVLNGAEIQLSLANLSTNSGGGTGLGTTNQFIINGISNDCNEIFIINLSLENDPPKADLTGTYPVKEFSALESNYANGFFESSVISPLDVSTLTMVSGTVLVTQVGNNNFTLDLSAEMEDGTNLTMRLVHQFI